MSGMNALWAKVVWKLGVPLDAKYQKKRP